MKLLMKAKEKNNINPKEKTGENNQENKKQSIIKTVLLVHGQTD